MKSQTTGEQKQDTRLLMGLQNKLYEQSIRNQNGLGLTVTLKASKKGRLQNSEGKNFQILFSAKLSIRCKDRIKTFRYLKTQKMEFPWPPSQEPTGYMLFKAKE